MDAALLRAGGAQAAGVGALSCRASMRTRSARAAACAGRARGAHRGCSLRVEAIAAGPADNCSQPTGWKGDRLLHSSLPLLPSGTPDYASIDRLPQSLVLTATIRKLLVREVGKDNDPRPWTDFAALMTPVREVNDMPGNARDVQLRAKRVFSSILPELGLGWVPALWKAQVQPRFPVWTTNYAFFGVFYLLFPWLMGPMKGEDHVEVEVPQKLRSLFSFLPATVSLPQSVKAERCRFLETAQCASVCVNSCKVPTQEWLKEDFGLDLHIQPNYQDFSCKWEFAKVPPPLAQDEAILTPCFALCPSEFKGQKDAAKQVMLMKGDTLEAIAARASAEAVADATQRLEAVSSGGKCWSIDEERAKAMDAMAAK